jgi:hypothetical protein
MKVHLIFAPRDADEPIDGLEFDMPDAPRPGDRITIQRPGQEGATDFIVRQRSWMLEHPQCAPAPEAGKSVVGSTRAVTIECEFTVGAYSSEEHKRVAAGL